MVRVRSYCACARAAKHIASCALGLSFFSSLVGQTKLEKKIDQLLLFKKKLPNLGNKMEFGFPGHVLTLDSILEGILQDESTSSSSSDSSRPTHLSLDNIPDALPIKEEKEEGNTVDIMVRFLLAQFGHFGQNSKLPKTQTCTSCPKFVFRLFGHKIN